MVLMPDNLIATVETAEGFPEYMMPFVHISDDYLKQVDTDIARKAGTEAFNAAYQAFILENVPASTPAVSRKVVEGGGRIVYGYARIAYVVEVSLVGGTSESYEGHMWTLRLDSGKVEHESVTSYEANDVRSWMEKRL
jgi:hypothetical protein